MPRSQSSPPSPIYNNRFGLTTGHGTKPSQKKICTLAYLILRGAGLTIEAYGFGMRFMAQSPDVYWVVCADCIDAIRCSIWRVRCGVMPSNRSTTDNCPR